MIHILARSTTVRDDIKKGLWELLWHLYFWWLLSRYSHRLPISALTTAASAIYFNKLDLENANFLGYHRHSVSCHYMYWFIYCFVVLKCVFELFLMSSHQSEVKGSRSPQGCRTPSRSWHHSTSYTKTFCSFNRSLSQTAVALTHIQTCIVQLRQKLASYAMPSSERGGITGVTKERKDGGGDDENKKKQKTKKHWRIRGSKSLRIHWTQLLGAEVTAAAEVTGAGESRISSTERS